MRKVLVVFILLIIGRTISFAQHPVKISTADFRPVLGKWEGSLTYLDYKSGTPYTMPANVEISRLAGTPDLLVKQSYPDEPEANEADTVMIAAKGTLLDGEKVVSKRKLTDGNMEIVTEIQGVDGNENKPARMRHTYTLGRNVYLVRKDVLFDDEKEWVMRHEYRYERRMP